MERPDAGGGRGDVVRLTELGDRARESATRSSGPRFFHFVMGGGTPAALGADWLTSAYDQVAFAWASSPLAARLEQVTLDWLRQLFELPADFARGRCPRQGDGLWDLLASNTSPCGPTSRIWLGARGLQFDWKARTGPDANGSKLPIAAMSTERFPLSVPLEIRTPPGLRTSGVPVYFAVPFIPP